MTVADNSKRLGKIEKALFGNGEPGMDEDVRNIKKDIEIIKNEQREIRRLVELMKPVVSDMKELRDGLFDKFNIKSVYKDKSKMDQALDYFVQKILPVLIISGLTWIVTKLAGGV